MVTTFVQLAAEPREGTGKGLSRSLRREGRIPAIIYGGKKEEVKISADLKEVNHEYQKGHFSSKIVEIEVGGEKIRTLPRDIQVHPVTDKVLHVDFQRVNDEDRLKVQVAVVFKNADKSPGLKRGGVLNIVRRDVELLCNVAAIPSKLIVDLEGLQIGEAVHISNVAIPEGASPTITDRDFTIATIVGRMAKDDDGAAVAGGGDIAAEGEGAEGAEEGDEE